MIRPSFSSRRGSVLLVALCFVSVLGISLASYVTVCSRTMQISNRTAQTALSRQLAELGLEEALRAFNKNDWSDWSNGTAVDWTVSGTTATANLTFPAGTFGQGVTGSVKIRVDNYNAAQLSSTWTSGISYRTSDTVNHNGTWYRCVRATSSQVPNGISNMGYWVPAPLGSSWDSALSYKAQDVVFNAANNTWYRCILANSNQIPPNVTYWVSIPRITQDTGYTNTNIEVLMFFGTWYYYNSGWYSMPTNTPIVSWVWRSGYNYSVNDLVYYGTTPVWYRCTVPHTSSGSILPTNTAYWENALASASNTGSWAWNSATAYNLNDVVYRSGSFYRCILAHTNQGPPNTTYWSTAPLRSPAWDSGRQYSVNDTVSYKGLWYRCTTANNGSNPASSGNWSSTANSPWNSTTAYTTSSYVSYGGVWYRCILAHTGRSPNNSTYWTALSAPVVYAEGTINIAGSGSTKTQLRAPIAPAPLFPNAVAATTNLTISGGGTVSSYDSVTDPTAASPGYSAVLASTGTTNPAMTVTSTTVNGYVAAPSATATGAPMWTYGGSAVLKGAAVGTGIDATRVSRSPYIPKFDIQTVSGGTMLSTATATLGTVGATTPSIYYYNNAGVVNLRLNGATEILTIVGPVILYVTGNFRIDGSATAKIIITPTGSLRLVVARDFNIESTGGGIDNQTKDPSKLTVLCSRVGTDTFLYAATAQPFYGTIYIPNSSSTLTIGSGVTIYGALSAQNITFSGDANVFYDTSLRYAVTPGVDQPYGITEWRELTDATELATMP